MRGALGAAAIVLAAGAVPAPVSAATFARDVAPLLFRHCVPCHRPGGASRVSLLTYESARARARQIVEVTATRVMPPWQPEPGWGDFKGARRLSDAEVDVFRRWLDEGLQAGAAEDMPAPPAFSSDWELGPPDLVLTMPAFELRPEGPDLFRTFVLPIPNGSAPKARFVRAWEFRPGNAAVVHHATIQVDATEESRRFDARDAEPGYEGLIAPSARAPDGFFLDWAPGHGAQTTAPGTAWPLLAGGDFVMMVHMRSSGRAESVQASIGLYLTDEPPAHVPVMLRLTRQDLSIPAGASSYAVSDRYVLPVDVEVHTVQPHAHYLAREMRAIATQPDGTPVRLLRIPDWNFNWQSVYQYEHPVRLAAGTTLEMSIAYDNTDGNPRNPHRPPIATGYGQQTSDEMAEMWFQVIPVRREDREALVESVYRKVLPEEVRGRRAMLARDPDDIALRDDLALMLIELGDVAAAEREFRATLARRPESAAARFNVGLAVLARGDHDEAERLFDAAIAVDPSHGPSHLQLGLLRQADGRLREASTHLNAALAARPADAAAVLAAGVVDAMLGDDERALGRLRGALDLRPEWANAEAALASVLSSRADASPSDRALAVALAERANARTNRRNSPYLDIWATALAASGDLERAREIAREAIRVAESAGDASAAARLRSRLAALSSAR
jgi:tetratricopeptide (TPR) repeat protein/mono/diheme cytochrome c family protein